MLPSAGKKDALREKLLAGTRPAVKKPAGVSYQAPYQAPIVSSPELPEPPVRVLEDYSVSPLEGVIDEAERASRIERWEEIAQNYNTIEDAKESTDEYLARINQLGEQEHENFICSANMIDRTLGCHVPYYSTGVHDCIVRVEITGSNQEQPINWKPSKPDLAFGSTNKYKQGVPVAISNTKIGNLKNTYLIRCSIGMIASEFPFSIGVHIGEWGSLGEGKFEQGVVPWSGRKYYSDFGAQEYHFIIPPYHKSDTLCNIYRSSAEVHNEYGLEYTYLTDDYASITTGCKKSGDDGMLVPKNSPLLRWLFRESGVLDSELGVPSRDHEKHWLLTMPVYTKAWKAIQERVRAMLPVRDFEKFYVCFTPLIHSPASQLSLHRELYYRDRMFEEKAKLFEVASATREELKKNKNMFSLVCDLHFIIMFRDQTDPEVKKA